MTKLTEGETAAGIDIEVPLSTLHTIVGHLVARGTGLPINAGVISLKSTTDGATLLSTEVMADDGQFHLSFVPEGTFLLEVSNARSVRREHATDNPLTSGDPKESVLSTFRDSRQQLIVTGDLSSLTVEADPIVSSSQ